MKSEKNRPELNDEQRAAAFCAENVVVAAGAGSGKTMVLASRFAWLVTEKNYRVDQILTLTFTKKAAAQMYRRIHDMLGEIADEYSDVRGERARQALNDFVHARIQTLDSYCASLVRQAASRYGINPNFAIDEGRCREIAFEETLPFLIARRHHPAIRRLYPQKSPERIAGEVFAAAVFNYSHIDDPPDFFGDLKKQSAVICAEWKAKHDSLEKTLKELEGLAADDKTLLPELAPLMVSFNSGKIICPGAAEIRGYFNFLFDLSEKDEAAHSGCIEAAESHPIRSAVAAFLQFLSRLYSLDLRKGKRSNNPIKKIIIQFRESLFGEFSSLAVFCMQAGLIISVMSLLSDLQRRYLNKKRTGGVLTFTDVARLARTILLEQKDIRQSEKESFREIMIDEFQDNNELQKNMLFLLAEKAELMNEDIPSADSLSPGRLFFVGDEKQSIYRFRGADVSVFRKLKDELKGGDLPLKTNYRSAPDLIDAFNVIFGGSNSGAQNGPPPPEYPSVFVPPAPSVPLYEAFYTPLRAGKNDKGKLTVCILDKKDEDNAEGAGMPAPDRLTPVENEARFVAERIQRLLKEKDDAGKAKYRPDDIAILFRARRNQYLFEKHLRQLNIPYAGEDMNEFFFGGPVNDIMSILRLAAYPLDTAAYAEALRSPFAGLSLPGLAACLAIFKNGGEAAPFTEAPLSRLTEEDRVKYRQGQKIYNLIREKAGSECVSSLISELWYALGYRYETEWNPQTAVYRELYDYLFHLAVQADAKNGDLAAFTDSIQVLRNSGDRIEDVDIPLERADAVRLLTVHKSKGLEFPVVFICCCDKHGLRNGGGDIYDTGDAGIAFNPPLPPECSTMAGVRRNYFWERSVVEEKRKRTAEMRRLLYVGMTRAEKELYLTGCLGIGKDEEKNAFSPRLKRFIEEKREKAGGGNAIPGDAILDDDTFFGLFLPALAAHIPAAHAVSERSFFSLEEIPAYTDEYIRASETGPAVFSNDQKGLSAFLGKTEAFYRNAEIIRASPARNNHLAPTSAPKADNAPAARGFVVSKEFSGENAGTVFDRIDNMLARFANRSRNGGECFNSGSFGTIAHVCTEALLNGKKALVPPKLAGCLTTKEADAFLDAGNELAARFVRSPIGTIAHNAISRKSEFSFRSLIKDSSGNEVFISGIIDLLFEDKQTVHVVDFKTDKCEVPGEHATQMACYYEAASSMFAVPAKKKCRVWLYYLRTGHAVEMTEKVKQFSLESLVR